MLSYPVRLIPTAEKRVRAVVLDVPDAISEGATEDEAMENIKALLSLRWHTACMTADQSSRRNVLA